MDIDIRLMAECLDAVTKTRPDEQDVSLQLINRPLGVKLKLDIQPASSRVRLHIDRMEKPNPTFIGTITVEEVISILINPTQDEVRFIGDRYDLVVNKQGTFRLTAI